MFDAINDEPTIEETLGAVPTTSPALEPEIAAEMAAAFGYGNEPEQSPAEIEAEYQWWLKREAELQAAELTSAAIERACSWGSRWDEKFATAING